MHTAASGAPSTKRAPSRSITRRPWLAISSAFAAVLGLAPHVLHHAGPLAGAALFAGVGGSLFFGALGFLLAIPFLIRLRRRFGTWRAPIAALVLFTAMFSISTFVLGPALAGNGSGGSNAPGNERQTPATPQSEHESHHD